MNEEAALRFGVDVATALERLEELRRAFERLEAIGKVPEAMAQHFKSLDEQLMKLIDHYQILEGAADIYDKDDVNDLKEVRNEIVATTSAMKRMETAIEQTGRTNRKISSEVEEQLNKQRAAEEKLAKEIMYAEKVTKLHTLALKENANWSKNSESITLRLMKATEGLRLEVSRIRNMILLWNFALNMIIEPIQRAIKAQAEFERSTNGLRNVSIKLGIAVSDSNIALAKLTEDGMLKAGEASRALQQLLSTGIGLPEAIRLMQGFKDAAAYGRQGSLSYAEAVNAQAEGFKILSSQLMDAGGITKNISDIIIDEAAAIGKTTKSLSEHEKHLLLAKGLTKEFALSKGDAKSAATGLDGALNKLEASTRSAQEAFGKFIYEKGGGKEVISILDQISVAAKRAFQSLNGENEEGQDPASWTIMKFGLAATSTGMLDQVRMQQEYLKQAQEMRDRAARFARESREMAMNNGPIPFGKQDNPLLDKFTLPGFSAAEPGLPGRQRMFVDSIVEQSNLKRIGADPDQFERMREQAKEWFDKKIKSLADMGNSSYVKNALAKVQKDYEQVLLDIQEKENASKSKKGNREASAREREIKNMISQAESAAIRQTLDPYEERRKAVEKTFSDSLTALDEMGTTEAKQAAVVITKYFTEAIKLIDEDEIADNLAKTLAAATTNASNRATRGMKNLRGVIASLPGAKDLDGLQQITSTADMDRVNSTGRKQIEAAKKLALATVNERVFAQQYEAETTIKNKDQLTHRLNEIEEAAQADREGIMTSAAEAIERLQERTKDSYQRYMKDKEDTGNKILTEAEKKQEELDKRREAAQNKASAERIKSLNNTIKVFSNLNNVVRQFDTNGSTALAKLTGSAEGAAEAVKGLSAIMKNASTGDVIGGIASVIGGVGAIIETFQGDKNRRKAEARRAAQFGATVSRGPQTVNIFASLSVESGHDTIFSEDGVDIIKNNLVQRMQEAYDNGEVVFN